MPDVSVTDPIHSASYLQPPPHDDVELVGAPNNINNNNRNSQISPALAHPVAVFFHLFFKGVAIFFFLFYSFLFSNYFVIGFILSVLTLSFDFWTVQNVTGRLLVGLRWWNEVKEDGSNVWIFESKPENRNVNPSDSLIFWVTLYATPVVWMFLGLLSLLGQWSKLLIVFVALMLSVANLVGYWKCQKDAKQKIQKFATQFLAQQL